MDMASLMKIKTSQPDTTSLLWKESPCTLRNVLQNPSMDLAPRFHYGSIYFKDEVSKPKKVFTEFEKPQLILHNFRRQLKEVDIQARKLSVNNKGTSTGRDRSVSKRMTCSVNTKFYEKPELLDLKHDRFGNRSSYMGNYDVKELNDKVKQRRRNFCSSNRIDLSKPDNFFPGPGTYFPASSSSLSRQSSKPMRHTFSERIRINSMKI